MPSDETPPTTTGAEPFRYVRPVRWGDIDAADIVYTGKVPEFVLEAIECWYEERLGVSWFELKPVLGVDTPCVHLSIDLRAPVYPRERVEITVALARIGRSSLDFELNATKQGTGTLCWRARFVFACIDPDSFAAVAIPADFRARLENAMAVDRQGTTP